MDERTVITVAPAAMPADELVRTAKACEAIGAAVVRVPDGAEGAVDALRQETGLVVQARGAAGALPVYEIRDRSGLARAQDPVHYDLILGDGMPGTVEALVEAVRALPPGATYTAVGVGDAALPVMLAALAAGGHLRVGLADTPLYAPGQPARDNAQLVARAAGLARIAQRPPATPAETRTLLGLPT